MNAGNGSAWIGASALQGGKGYAPSPLGQIHYRAVGTGTDTPILLLHQTPLGLVEYVDVQAMLARGGRHSIASDNPGYGYSDLLPASVTIDDLANNLLALLDHLRLERVIVAGHHSGAAIAAAFAARQPQRTAAVILHGSPLYTAQERAQRLARPAADMTLLPDGSHFSNKFAAIATHAGSDPDTLASVTWAVLGQFLCGAHSPTYEAVFANDMAPDIAAIRAPTLLLSDTDDSLHAMDLKVASLRPDFRYQEFSNGRSFALMQHAQAWANVVIEFARVHGL